MTWPSWCGTVPNLKNHLDQNKKNKTCTTTTSTVNSQIIACIHICDFEITNQNARLIIAISGNKGNNKITELRTILQRESQNS